jgi:uncharacterized membrane protein YhhN
VPWLVLTPLVVALLVAEASEARRGVWLLKPCCSAVFVLAGLWAGPFDARWETALFAGLVLGALGDVLLIPKSREALLFGLFAFLLGHLAYVYAFFLRGFSFEPTFLSFLVLSPVIVVVDRWLKPHLPAAFVLPVKVYSRVIAAMVAFGVGTFALHGDARILLGATLFFLSDLAVARERFVEPGFENRLVGLPLYFGGQLLLASALGGG